MINMFTHIMKYCKNIYKTSYKYYDVDTMIFPPENESETDDTDETDETDDTDLDSEAL